MSFRLPIEYQKTFPIAPSMARDLELTETVDASGIAMYDCVFQPETPLARASAARWANVYTDDVDFLQQNVLFLRTVELPPVGPTDFIDVMLRVQTTAEFETVFQYVEYKRLGFLNANAMFLTCMSVYSMTSPILFILSPLLLLLFPFVLLKSRNLPITWSEYKVLLTDVLKRHAIGGLLTGFSSANANQRMYLLATAVFFGVQMYSNVRSCVQFFKNMRYVYTSLHQARVYIDHVQATATAIEAAAGSSFKPFLADMNASMSVLRAFRKELESATFSLLKPSQIGHVRRLFFELKTRTPLKAAFDYTLGLRGFAENMSHVQMLLRAKTVNACVFAPGTKFVKAVYPPGLTHHRNTYSVRNMTLTGPNAAGKTTLIKMTMLNVLFSQQLGVGFYKAARIEPYQQLCCYMNIPDTSGRDSLFQAEARRCKEILDSVGPQRMLCIFDELFSGTNPHEASASAYAFLKYLMARPQCTFLLTTHFLDVCTKLSGQKGVRNMRMETVDGVHTYKLASGISRVRGGLQVLKDLSYPVEITECAKLFG